MFLQLINNAAGSPESNMSALFQYHPLQLTALVETIWRNRVWTANMPFDPWPQKTTDRILADFPTSIQPVKGGDTTWDHLVYAYLIENTRIFDIFQRVVETYQSGEQLETPSPETQRFLRNTEYLVFSDPAPTTVWNLTSRTRPDEIAQRMMAYWWALGLDLSHARELSAKHPYTKPAAANRDFVPTFETFAREVWRGIVNAANTSGANPTDAEAIATSAQRIFDMFVTRRQNGNLSREEFRAVSVMSWLHLAVSFNSPVVVDLKADASSPEQRLFKIAERVGMRAHSKAKAFFDLAQPFSTLVQAIEQGTFNEPLGARALYLKPKLRDVARVVIDQYGITTGRDLKAGTMVLTQTAATPPALPASRPPAMAPARA